MTGSSDPWLDESSIRRGLLELYGARAVSLTLLTGGLDHRARTLRVATDAASTLVLRLSRDAPSPVVLQVPRYLRDLGIDAVVAPIPALDGQLVVRRDGFSWSLSPYVDGVGGWEHGMTAVEWTRLGAVLRSVHDTRPPAALSSIIRRDPYDVQAYAGAFYRCDDALKGPSAKAPPPFVQAWESIRETSVAILAQLERLAVVLRAEPRPSVLCHGDLHPGNVLVTAEAVHLIDWDGVLFAPRERDLIFVPDLPQPGARPRGPGGAPSHGATSALPVGPRGSDPGTGSTASAGEAFVAAYAPRGMAVDWVALTYYRCERVIQDVIEEALRALAPARADEDPPELWLRHIFQSGGEADDAIATAQCLPDELRLLAGQTVAGLHVSG